MSSTWVIAGLSLATGFFFGAINDITNVTLKTEANILDVLSFLVTIAIAIFVPSYIKKAIDDRKDVKLLVVGEVKELIALAKEPHKIVQTAFVQEQAIGSTERDKVVDLFFDTELKNDSIREQITISFDKHSAIADEITTALFQYKSFLTGGKFMNSRYKKIDYDFFQEDKKEFAELEKRLMRSIHQIHKF